MLLHLGLGQGAVQLVADVDDGGVVDQVEALDVEVEHLGAEELPEQAGELVLVADGAVERDHLIAVAAHELGVVAHEQGGENQRHEDGGQSEAGRHAADQTDGQGREEVGDLALGQGGGAQPDDRQDAEEPQAQPRSQALRVGQQEGDCQHAHVDADVGGHKVTAPVAGYVEGPHQDGQSHYVDADGGECGKCHRRTPFLVIRQGRTGREHAARAGDVQSNV